jgi:hypothetical protein
MVDQAVRKQNAISILNISDAIDENYDKLIEYNETGILPAAKKEAAPEPKEKDLDKLDKAELIIHQQNIRTYVSRYKRFLKNAKTPDQYNTYQKSLERYQLMLETAERRLNEY